MATRIDELLTNPPKLHLVEGELSARWMLQEADLRYLGEVIKPGMRTLETGAGLSTLVFAIQGADHTCVVPDPALVHRIQMHCASAEISLAATRFVVEPSERALPRLSGENFDFVLIDGRHGFPQPFLDAYYAARLLRIGGCVMVDDLHIWTADLLVRYMKEERSWKSLRETWHAASFEKIDDDALAGEWTNQPFVWNRSVRKSFLAKLRLLKRMVLTRDFTPVRLALRR